MGAAPPGAVRQAPVPPGWWLADPAGWQPGVVPRVGLGFLVAGGQGIRRTVVGDAPCCQGSSPPAAADSVA